MRVADYVIDQIYKAGCEHIFLVTGGGAMFLNDAVVKSKNVTFAANHNEQASSICAEAYSRISENIGVAIAGGLLGLLGIFVYIQITLSDGGHLDESDGAKSIGLSFIQLISLLITFPIAW